MAVFHSRAEPVEVEESKLPIIIGVIVGVLSACLVSMALAWRYLYIPRRDKPPDAANATERASTISADEMGPERGYAGLLHRLKRSPSPEGRQPISEKLARERITLPPGAQTSAFQSAQEEGPLPEEEAAGKRSRPRPLGTTPPTCGTPIAPISEASTAPSTPLNPITPLAPAHPTPLDTPTHSPMPTPFDSPMHTPIVRPTSPEPPELPDYAQHTEPSAKLTNVPTPPLYGEEWCMPFRLDEPRLVTRVPGNEEAAKSPLRTQVA